MNILLIEDDSETADYISNSLSGCGYTVAWVDNGRDGTRHAIDSAPDMLIVDRMLPDIDGISLVKTIKIAGCKAPVLFLSALGGLDDRVTGQRVARMRDSR